MQVRRINDESCVKKKLWTDLSSLTNSNMKHIGLHYSLSVMIPKSVNTH